MAKKTVGVKLFTEFNGGNDMLDLDYVMIDVSEKQLKLLLTLEEKLNEQNEKLMKPNEGIWLSVEEF